ncbi:hypothetical protein Tco_0419113 [Tanacetum coccineum]
MEDGRATGSHMCNRIDDTSVTHVISTDAGTEKFHWAECMTRSSTKELFIPFKEPERVFHFTSVSEEVIEVNKQKEPTMEEYMTITRINYESGNEKGRIELKGRFLIELRDNAFSGINGYVFSLFLLLELQASGGKMSPLIETNEVNIKVDWDSLLTIEFESQVRFNHLENQRRWYTRYTHKNALWDYWRRGDDEEIYLDLRLMRNIKMIGSMSGMMKYHVSMKSHRQIMEYGVNLLIISIMNAIHFGSKMELLYGLRAIRRKMGIATLETYLDSFVMAIQFSLEINE